MMNLAAVSLLSKKRNYNFFKIIRQYRSIIYLSGERATDTCAVVTPQIDIDKLLKNGQKLKSDLEKRGVYYNIDGIMEIWDFLSVMNKTKVVLEKRRDLIFDTIKDLKGTNLDNQTELEKLAIHLRILRTDLKVLKNSLLPIEENFMMDILSLPNYLHHKTPNNESILIETFETKCSEISEKSHIEIGVEFDILNYLGPYNYYLKKDAAIFELSAKFYFSEKLRNLRYIQFSNPDFTKSAIVEGCGLDYTNPNNVFILHQKEESSVNEMRLHLTGGGSLFAFIAYHARNVIQPKAFPLRYFCLGRQYKPVSKNSKLGLFEVSQASVVEVFIATKDCNDELEKEIDKIYNDVTSIYKTLGYHFRTLYCPVKDLLQWECLKISFEMFSPHLNRYVEIGSISVSDNYISKRLQFLYKEEVDRFPKIISATVLNVPKVLGCVIENNPQKNLQSPNVFQNIF